MALALLASTSTKANDGEQSHSIIIATPNQCVALNQGQVCFQALTLVWESTLSGDFCVYSSQMSTPLKCWESKQQGELALEVEAKEDVEFSLHLRQPKSKVASALMRVAWVYKQKRKRLASWRLF